MPSEDGETTFRRGRPCSVPGPVLPLFPLLLSDHTQSTLCPRPAGVPATSTGAWSRALDTPELKPRTECNHGKSSDLVTPKCPHLYNRDNICKPLLGRWNELCLPETLSSVCCPLECPHSSLLTPAHPEAQARVPSTHCLLPFPRPSRAPPPNCSALLVTLCFFPGHTFRVSHRAGHIFRAQQGPQFITCSLSTYSHQALCQVLGTQ